MSTDVSVRPISVLEMRRELADHLFGYETLCRDSLELVLNSIIERINKLKLKTIDNTLAFTLKERVVQKRLKGLKERSVEDYCGKVLLFDNAKIAELFQQVVREKQCIQDPMCKDIIDKKVSCIKQNLISFVMHETDSLREIMNGDVMAELKEREELKEQEERKKRVV